MKRLFLGLLAASLFQVASAQQQSASDLELYAKSGNVAAMRQLGECYIQGDGVGKNEALGWQWLEKAAAGGDAEAKKLVDARNNTQKQQSMGGDFLKGYKDQQVRNLAYDMLNDEMKGYSDAAQKLRALALDGNMEAIRFMFDQRQLPASACVTLGQAFENGQKGLKKNLGWANRMYRLALFFDNNTHVARSFNATKEEKQAALDGVLRMYDEGYGIIDKYVDLKKIKADADKGDALSCEMIGYYYYEKSDFYHALVDDKSIAPGADLCLLYYQKAVELKRPEAMVSLGKIFQNYKPTDAGGGQYYDWLGMIRSMGDPSLYPDYPELTTEDSERLEKALKKASLPLYRDAAIAGSVEGMLLTGQYYEDRTKFDDYFYEHGSERGLSAYEMARGWYAKAADKGSYQGANGLRDLALKRWEKPDEKAKEPDSTVVNYFKRIIADNDTTGIGPFLASANLGVLYYSLYKESTYDVVGYDISGSEAVEYLKMAVSYPDKAKYPSILSWVEYLIGNLAELGKGDYYGFNDYEDALAWYNKALQDYPQTTKDSWKEDQYQTILKAIEKCQNELAGMTDEDRAKWQKKRLMAQAKRNAAAGLDMRLIENNYIWDYTKGPDPAGNETWNELADWEIDGALWWKAHGFDPNKPMTRSDMIHAAYNKGKRGGEGRGYADYQSGLPYDPQKMCPTSSSQVMVGSEEEFRAYVKGYLDGYEESYRKYKRKDAYEALP